MPWATTKPWRSATRVASNPWPCGPPAAGRRRARSSRSNKRAGVSASTFTARSIFKTGQTRMIEVETVDAASAIRLLESIAALYPMLVLIHVFLDNARTHHAKMVREWLARPGCRIKLHFLPSYCRHLNAACGQFTDATLDFLRAKVPKNWNRFRDSVTDNFRVVSPKDFRVLT
ncbi:MAG: transposase [Methylocella sp.]